MKSGKLRKLMKNWPSFTTRRISKDTPVGNEHDHPTAVVEEDVVVNSSSASTGNENLQAVYVGRSRRQYFVTSEVINHPLFQVLVQKSGDGHIVVSCEVVLFEHLLWMLNDDSNYFDPKTMDELVQFYTTS